MFFPDSFQKFEENRDLKRVFPKNGILIEKAKAKIKNVV